MIHHGFAPQAFICATIIPIPKSAKGALTCSDKYRSIAINSVIGKILDHIIIDRQSKFLETSDYRCGFKPKSSTILCSTMVNETIQYYTENGGKRVYVLLLDVTKAFNKVLFKVVFDLLLDKKVCPKIVQLLYFMYTNQLCHVKWGGEKSARFSISNGVKQGGVISHLLFSLYVDELFLLLNKFGLGCQVWSTYAGAFRYADDIALIAPSLSSLKQNAENFAKSHNIVFNSSKTKLLCYNKDPQTVILPIYLNREQVSVVKHEKHLGIFLSTHFLSTNIYDRNIISNVCDLYQRSNLMISDFRVCDCITLDSLFNTYCIHMYGCELWNLSCKYIDEFKVAGRKIKRRVWRLHAQAHNTIVNNLTCDVDHQLDNRMLKFIHMCLNHHNQVCRSLLLSKVNCKTQRVYLIIIIYLVIMICHIVIGT